MTGSASRLSHAAARLRTLDERTVALRTAFEESAAEIEALLRRGDQPIAQLARLARLERLLDRTAAQEACVLRQLSIILDVRHG